MNTALTLAARLIFAAVFAMAVFFKLSNIGQTAAYIGRGVPQRFRSGL
jgi:uncharacterized membrane protein YphA (DoxX/SURF4 family)